MVVTPARQSISENGGSENIYAETYFDVVSLFLGVKEAVEIYKLQRRFEIPLRMFVAWLRQQIKKGTLKEALDDLLRVSRNHKFYWGAGGAKQVIE
jgi:hypothetical protein